MASRKQRLCRTCATLFDNPNTEAFRYEGAHHGDYSEVQRSADCGCYICIRLRVAVEKTLGDHTTQQPLKRSNYRVRPTHDIREWKLDFDIQLGGLAIQVQFLVLDHLQYSHKDLKCQISSKTSFSGRMSVAKAWLHNCRNHHNCQTACRNTMRGIYPTRLLQIRRSKSGSMHVRLQYSQDLPEDVEYLTLSHMWGDQKFLKLTSANCNDFLHQVSLMSLSQTFRDALQVTIELGFQYLWIDSLCILQDDQDDWQKESQRMAYIYKNAACNLCASMLGSEEQGLLTEARALNPHPPLIHFDGDSSSRTKVLSETKPWTFLRDSPLYRRAWVLQEQLLVRRPLLGTNRF